MDLATRSQSHQPATPPEWVARRLPLFPAGTTASADGLIIGGCDVAALAADFGTPLYVFDVATLDAAAAEYRDALANHYPGTSAITYAGKALLFGEMVRWVQAQGMWLDCTGVGELAIARAAGFPPARTLVHGVNKSPDDLRAAVAQAAVIVVDNPSELRRLLPLLADAPHRGPSLWLRVRPGVAVETHAYTQTGQSDSKFGMDAAEIRAAVRTCLDARVNLEGLHFHQGSHFHDVAPLSPALETALDLVSALRAATGWAPAVICPGGGWGVPYHEDDLPHPTISDYVRFVAERLATDCAQRGLDLPRLHVEPGRSLVARAGVAIYRVGTVKQSAERRWLLVDGGLADNPRPALYGARYSALPLAHEGRALASDASIAGPYCESGDVLIETIAMPNLAEEELVAIPVAGAYQLSMASNYNGARRAAVLFVREGEPLLVQRRETFDDLVRRSL